MKIDLHTIEHLARLSKLHFSEEEKKQLVEEVQNMVTFVEQLDSPDIEAYLPTRHMTATAAHVRADEAMSSMTPTEALNNAPEKHDGYFIVPKVISTPQ